MWSSSVFWKDLQSVIHIPFTFQLLFSFQELSPHLQSIALQLFLEHNNNKLETLAGLWLYKGTDLLLLPFCNSFSLQLEKPEEQHRDKSAFSRVIYLPQSLQTVLDSASLQNGDIGDYWKCLQSYWLKKSLNTLEKPSSSRGSKGRKSSTEEQSRPLMKPLETRVQFQLFHKSLSNFIFQLTICKYIWRSIFHFRSQTLSCWEHRLLSFQS